MLQDRCNCLLDGSPFVSSLLSMGTFFINEKNLIRYFNFDNSYARHREG